MKHIPEGLKAHLESGATTLCHCWKLTRKDGVLMGFTDHDQPLAIDGLVFEAASGFTATAMESGLGLSIDNQDVAGALCASGLGAQDLAAGLYDEASVEIYRVNWRNVDERLLLRKATLGEVRHGPTGFTAELRGLAHRLNQAVGRLYQYGCDAELGDARCKVDTDAPAFSAAGTVETQVSRRIFSVNGLGGFAPDWFARGRIAWQTGANAGRIGEVKRHTKNGDAVTLELWQAMPDPVATGDGFKLVAGCDKQFATCRDKFANRLNFRGCPHMPGTDWVITFPSKGDGNDGASRNR
ncbi:MAG: DUF2163 domain-containing protein [Alphaproteobacteria bacterium]|nr:DUF2163 domain-containing protein [Alphaproteobacteria bacterium]